MALRANTLKTPLALNEVAHSEGRSKTISRCRLFGSRQQYHASIAQKRGGAQLQNSSENHKLPYHHSQNTYIRELLGFGNLVWNTLSTHLDTLRAFGTRLEHTYDENTCETGGTHLFDCFGNTNGTHGNAWQQLQHAEPL